MLSTKNLKRHHTELLQMISEMSKMLDPQKLGQDDGKIRTELSRFSGKLLVHLSMEDESLYPVLVGYGKDPSVEATATKFINDMGYLRGAFEAYLKKWLASKAIQGNPADFVRETRDLFSAISGRIDKEERELYAMVDKLK